MRFQVKASPAVNFGSYSEADVTFLLKDISAFVEEQDNDFRERAIQGGRHYSEMLPIEYEPKEEYMNLFYSSLEKEKLKLAYGIAILSEKILKAKGKRLVLVSLARAGTPIGILIKRYIKYAYDLDLPHYTISIIKDKGIDENAIKYILEEHHKSAIQFIDGWTGKGTIKAVLHEALLDFYNKYGIKLCDSLAVLADPAGIAQLYGLREDFLIPSACLNSTVSGLVSRTMVRGDIINKEDFHGAKYYKGLEKADVSNIFLHKISENFQEVSIAAKNALIDWTSDDVQNLGVKDIAMIKKLYSIDNENFIKPGIGETTRVLLRRVPYKIIVRDKTAAKIKHIVLLAKDKGVPVEEAALKVYNCVGIIKNLKEL